MSLRLVTDAATSEPVVLQVCYCCQAVARCAPFNVMPRELCGEGDRWPAVPLCVDCHEAATARVQARLDALRRSW